MDKKTEALKLALEALEEIESYYGYDRSVGAMASSMYEASNLAKITSTRIREALAEDSSGTEQPAQNQEPVAVARVDDLERGGRVRALAMGLALDAPLYTSPPASKPWVGLTLEESLEFLPSAWRKPPHKAPPGWAQTVQAIEAKLREKNT